MLKALIITTGLLLSSASLAGETSNASCQIAEGQTISASMTKVRIGDRVYKVKGADNRYRFIRMLENCGFNDAAYNFERWRSARRQVNTGAAIAVLTGGIASPVGAIFGVIGGIKAGEKKAAMVRDLRARK